MVPELLLSGNYQKHNLTQDIKEQNDPVFHLLDSSSSSSSSFTSALFNESAPVITSAKASRLLPQLICCNTHLATCIPSHYFVAVILVLLSVEPQSS